MSRRFSVFSSEREREKKVCEMERVCLNERMIVNRSYR